MENRLAEFEECFGICFQIKDAKNISKKDELLLEKINNERDESLDLFNANMSENDTEYNEGNYNYEIQQHDEAKNINHENFRISKVNTDLNVITKTQAYKRSFTVLHNISPKQKPIILKQNNTPKTPEKTSPRKIITTQTKEQKNFNDKIESEQVKLSDEFSKLRNDMNIFKKEMRDCYKNEIDSLKSEIMSLKKENKTLRNTRETNEVCKSDLTVIKADISKLKSSLSHHCDVEAIELGLSANKSHLERQIKKTDAYISELNNKLELQNHENEIFKQTVGELSTRLNSMSNDLVADSENPWQLVGKKGRIINTITVSDSCEVCGTPRMSNTFDILIFGDSITKFINPAKIAKCEPEKALNYSTSGARVRGIYDQFREFKNDYPNATSKNIIIHVGTNHFGRDNPDDTSRKVGKLLTFIGKEMPNSKVHFSSILPRYDASSLRPSNYINYQMYLLCEQYENLNFIGHPSFVADGVINHNLFRKDMLHPSGHVTGQLARDFIQSVRVFKS